MNLENENDGRFGVLKDCEIPLLFFPLKIFYCQNIQISSAVDYLNWGIQKASSERGLGTNEGTGQVMYVNHLPAVM